MDNHDDQQDLFQEIVCQLWKSYDSLETKVNFRLGCIVCYQYSNCIFKERKEKVDKYEIVSENIKEETDDSELKKVKIEHFTKQFKN
jgi:RNA polymerase sigma-70 factor (ECF subfamily)